jgi:hypothetical protein
MPPKIRLNMTAKIIWKINPTQLKAACTGWLKSHLHRYKAHLQLWRVVFVDDMAQLMGNHIINQERRQFVGIPDKLILTAIPKQPAVRLLPRNGSKKFLSSNATYLLKIIVRQPTFR